MARPKPAARPSRSRGPARHRAQSRPAQSPLADLLLPVIPSVLSSMAVNEVSRAPGWAKAGVGAALGLLLWAVVRARSGAAPRVPDVLRWPWLAALGLLQVLALGVTVATRLSDGGRPTNETVVVVLAAFAVLLGAAWTGRRVAGAAAAAAAGGVLGLCLGILAS